MEKEKFVLPEDFDGIFRFTNPTDEDFVGRWNGKEYVFKAMTTSPMNMFDYSPLEIQNIRKHFAKKLAEREFFKSEEYKKMTSREILPDGMPRLSSFHSALTYDEGVLKEYIQACLKPLPISKHETREGEKESVTEKLHRDEDGHVVTKPISGKGKRGIKDLVDEFEG